MTKRIVWVMLVFTLCLPLFAQQGKYERKSVSAVESVWLQRGALQGVSNFDYDFFDKMVKHYIELDRFDYNYLPKSLLVKFRNKANSRDYITADIIADIMSETLGPQIQAILGDPAIQELRAGNLRDESFSQTFAGSKAKEMGLTETELERLMNSAYIYLPFIKSMKMEEEKGNITVTITGGIVWYQVLIDGNGNVSMKLLKAVETYAIGSSERNPKEVMGIKADYSHFDFGNERFKTTIEKYAQYDAIQAWTKNLSVKTKEIDDFKLSAKINNILSGSEFKLNLGFKEGVHLDDGFFITDAYEDKNGEIKTKKIGFGRITKTADNRGDSIENSDAKLYYGKVTEGSVAFEHPRLGIDNWAKIGFQTGMVIPEEIGLYKEEVNEQIVANIGFGYNLAPIIGVSQTFFNMELGYGLPLGENSPYNEDILAYTLSAYGGISKKFWLGRNSLQLGAMGGYDRMAMTWAYLGLDNKLTINAWGVKGGAEIILMINQDLQFTLGADFKLGMIPTGVTLEIGDYSYDWSGGGIPKPYSDINFSGMILHAGFSYSLGELPINLFGWLDPLKKY